MAPPLTMGDSQSIDKKSSTMGHMGPPLLVTLLHNRPLSPLSHETSGLTCPQPCSRVRKRLIIHLFNAHIYIYIHTHYGKNDRRKFRSQTSDNMDR